MLLLILPAVRSAYERSKATSKQRRQVAVYALTILWDRLKPLLPVALSEQVSLTRQAAMSAWILPVVAWKLSYRPIRTWRFALEGTRCTRTSPSTVSPRPNEDSPVTSMPVVHYWTFTVLDNDPGDTGTIESVELRITSNCPCEVSCWTLTMFLYSSASSPLCSLIFIFIQSSSSLSSTAKFSRFCQEWQIRRLSIHQERQVITYHMRLSKLWFRSNHWGTTLHRGHDSCLTGMYLWRAAMDLGWSNVRP